jgi:hypothetical protein
MSQRTLLCGSVCVLTWLVSVNAFADGMRCGTKLVSDGDSLHDVRSRCGEPDHAERRVEKRTVRRWVQGPCLQDRGAVRCGQMVERTVEVVIDEWTYDFGPHKFVHYLTFEQDTLLTVRTGSYGKAR